MFFPGFKRRTLGLPGDRSLNVSNSFTFKDLSSSRWDSSCLETNSRADSFVKRTSPLLLKQKSPGSAELITCLRICSSFTFSSRLAFMVSLMAFDFSISFLKGAFPDLNLISGTSSLPTASINSSITLVRLETYLVSRNACRRSRTKPVSTMKINSTSVVCTNQTKRKEVAISKPTLALMFQKKNRLSIIIRFRMFTSL